MNTLSATVKSLLKQFKMNQEDLNPENDEELDLSLNEKKETLSVS